MPMSNRGLTKLAEECGELVQVVCKRIAYIDNEYHPDGSNQDARMIEEMGDVLAAVEFVRQKFDLSAYQIEERLRMKLHIFQSWDNDPTA